MLDSETFKRVIPETPTEFALVKYVEHLQREIIAMGKWQNPMLLKPSPVEVERIQLNEYWMRGIAMATVDRSYDDYGSEIKIIGRQQDKREFQMGIFIDDTMIPSLSKVSTTMAILYKEALHHLSHIYDKPE